MCVYIFKRGQAFFYKTCMHPIFKLIQRESGEKWEAMFENYNMGTGFEVIAKPKAEEEILSISEDFGLEAKVIGRCERSDGRNKLTIEGEFGNCKYE